MHSYPTPARTLPLELQSQATLVSRTYLQPCFRVQTPTCVVKNPGLIYLWKLNSPGPVFSVKGSGQTLRHGARLFLVAFSSTTVCAFWRFPRVPEFSVFSADFTAQSHLS